LSTPFTAGDSGYHTYRIPALLYLGGGVLLAFCEGRVTGSGDDGDIDIVLRRSLDGGATWGPLQAVTGYGADTAGNPCVVLDPASGDVVLLSCRQAADDTSYEIRTGQAPARRVYVQRSGDAGATWTSPVEITSQVRPSWMRHYGTGPGHGVAVTTGQHAGRLVAPCWHTRAPAVGSTDTGAESRYYGAHVIYSDNGGVSWAVGATSSNANGTINENESTAAELPDGRLYFTCRRQSDERPGHRADAYSNDGGATFEVAYRVQATLPLPVVQGSVIALPDGRLLHSGPTHPEERAGMGLWVSVDEGATWDLRHQVTGRLAAYSALVVDGLDVVVLYETGDWAPYERIELTRVPLAALT
jgi:sialidase-1